MSVTAVAQPTNSPPRFQITISSSDGSTITAVTLYKQVAGYTTQTTVQPSPGPSPLVVYDYLAEWDQPVTYSASVTTASGTTTFTAASAQITSAFPWAIHPFTPALSVCLDQGVNSAMGVVSIGSTTLSADNANRHTILGSALPVYTVSGPRGGAAFQLVVATVTSGDENALKALLNDLTPILIRTPAAWGWGFTDGYYQVQALTFDRFLQYGPEQRRVFTLPLEQVAQPSGTQQPARTWADVLAGFARWQDVSAAYTTWTNVLTDTRLGYGGGTSNTGVPGNSGSGTGSNSTATVDGGIVDTSTVG